MGTLAFRYVSASDTLTVFLDKKPFGAVSTKVASRSVAWASVALKGQEVDVFHTTKSGDSKHLGTVQRSNLELVLSAADDAYPFTGVATSQGRKQTWKARSLAISCMGIPSDVASRLDAEIRELLSALAIPLKDQ